MFLTNLKIMLAQRRQRKKLYSAADYWDTKAQQMNGHATSMWLNNHLNALYHQEQLKLIIESLPNIKHKKLLDLGCGTGRFAGWFATLGAIVTGIDFSDGALTIARRAARGGNPHYRQLSMFELDERATYDLIFCTGSIAMATQSHAELVGLMKKLHDALVPGGVTLLLEPLHRGFLHRVLEMEIKEFTTVMREAGFEIRFIKALHFWPMRLFLAYVPWPNLFTVPLYYLGQWIMKLPYFKTMGDYHAIYAVRLQ